MYNVATSGTDDVKSLYGQNVPLRSLSAQKTDRKSLSENLCCTIHFACQFLV